MTKPGEDVMFGVFGTGKPAPVLPLFQAAAVQREVGSCRVETSFEAGIPPFGNICRQVAPAVFSRQYLRCNAELRGDRDRTLCFRDVLKRMA